MYEGPYQIKEEIRPNAYLIKDLDGRTIGVYNSRQLKPHKDPKYKEIGSIQSASDDGYATDASRTSTDTASSSSSSSSSKAESPEKDDRRAKIKPILKKAREDSEKVPEKGKKIKKVRINRKLEYSPDEKSNGDKDPKDDKVQRRSGKERRSRRKKDDRSHEDLKQKKETIGKEEERLLKLSFRDVYIDESDDELVQHMDKFIQKPGLIYAEVYLEYARQRNLKKEAGKKQDSKEDKQVTICLLEIEEYSGDGTSTIDISDMPEGEPDDESVVFADKIIELSPNYCGACDVLDRVIQRPQVEASVLCCKFILMLDTDCDVNVMSKNLCECLLIYPDTKSVTVVEENPIPLYSPARRMVLTDVKVAGVTIHEPFLVIKNTALITAALGRIASERLINHLRFFDLLTGTTATKDSIAKDHSKMEQREDPHPEIDDILHQVEELGDPEVTQKLALLRQELQKRDELIAQKNTLLSLIRSHRAEVAKQSLAADKMCGGLLKVLESEALKTPGTPSSSTGRSTSRSSVVAHRLLGRAGTPASTTKSEPVLPTSRSLSQHLQSSNVCMLVSSAARQWAQVAVQDRPLR